MEIMRLYRVATAALTLWFLFLVYATVFLLRTNRPVTSDESLDESNDLHALDVISEKLKNALHKIKTLERQNEKLKVVIRENKRARSTFYNSTKSNTLTTVKNTCRSSLSLEYENARRFLENGITEFWLKIKSMLRRPLDDPTASKHVLNSSLVLLREQYTALYADALNLAQAGNGESERKRQLDALSRSLRQRLDQLQNPADCKSAKKLLCDLNKGCGFGCQIHHVVYCFITAYALNRTLILDSSGWAYSSRGWTSVFLPVSDKCTNADAGQIVHWTNAQESAAETIALPIIDSMSERPPQLPLSVPKDLQNDLVRLHGLPSVWWIGQFISRLWRFQSKLSSKLFDRVKTYRFFDQPVVGIHVRRTDKIGSEAAFHALDEYMQHADLWFDIQDAKSIKYGNGTRLKRRIYLATDESRVIDEARQRYSHYEVLADPTNAQSAGTLNLRYSDTSLRGVVADIHFLAHCQHLVCTFSSQVCRVAFELAQSLPRLDSSQTHKFVSLDDVYYFGGQHEHQQIAILDHTPRDQSEIELKRGDIIGLAGNHWDGYSKGRNHRTEQIGLFPSFKTQELIRVADFPSWPKDDSS